MYVSIGLWFDLDISYSGSFLMTLETKMNLIRLGKEDESVRFGEFGKDGWGRRNTNNHTHFLEKPWHVFGLFPFYVTLKSHPLCQLSATFYMTLTQWLLFISPFFSLLFPFCPLDSTLMRLVIWCISALGECRLIYSTDLTPAHLLFSSSVCL